MSLRGALLLVLALGLAPAVARAQEPGRIYRLGHLWLGSSDGQPSPWLEDIRAGMRERGYVEGSNLIIESRDARGQYAMLPGKAAELVSLSVDAILTLGSGPTLAAKEATQTIPIVFGSAESPVARGIVPSLARPGGNVTGFAGQLATLKTIAFLKDFAPHVRRLGMLYDTDNVPAAYLAQFLEDRTRAAEALGTNLVPQPVTNADDVDPAFAALASREVDAVVILNNALLQNARAHLASVALSRRLPTACAARIYAVAGCLFSYGEDFHDQYRRAAGYVDRIWKGAKPGDLPVEQNTKFELVVNRRTADALGLAIPASVMAYADEVIE